MRDDADGSYAGFTRGTREWPKCIAHGRRHRQAAAILQAQPHDVLLDYGCSDAHFLGYFPRIPLANRIGYDPDVVRLGEVDPSLAGAPLYSDRDALVREHAHRCTAIACMEVAEHLPEGAMREMFATLAALEAPGAVTMFGVPIETGLSGFLKQVYRVLRGNRNDSTWGTAFQALFSRPVHRPLEIEELAFHHSHTGFDHTRFARALRGAGYEIMRTTHLPFPLFGALLNNEVYFVCRRARS